MFDNLLMNEIEAEQQRGRAKYGNGPDDLAHDDTHTLEEWAEFIRKQLVNPTRKGMIKVAGLAVSAIRSHDRKACLHCSDTTKPLRTCFECKSSLCPNCYGEDVKGGEHCGNCEYPEG